MVILDKRDNGIDQCVVQPPGKGMPAAIKTRLERRRHLKDLMRGCG
jgi:hypothetical protein